MDYYDFDYGPRRSLAPAIGWVLTILSYLAGVCAVAWGPLTCLLIGLALGWAGRRLTDRPTYYGGVVGLGFVLGAGWVVWTRWIS